MSNLPTAPGTHALKFEQQDFALHIPAGYTPDQPRPLVLALHYGGPVSRYIGGDLLEGLIVPGLGALGAIFVAPNRLRPDWANSQAEADVFGLLNHIQANYAIDSSKTLLTGYSIGGIGTWYLAGRNQDYFKAALPISAPPPDEAIRTDWRIPLYVIHSRGDQLFPAEQTERVVMMLEEEDVQIALSMLEHADHFHTHLFVHPLQHAVPWVQAVWQA